MYFLSQSGYAIDAIKTRKTITSEKQVLQDYDKIALHLEESASGLINAVVILQKHENPFGWNGEK